MNTITSPGNTHHVATLIQQSQNVSRHTMSSREIAELTGSTHDNVLKTIRAYVAKGVVSSNDTPYVHPQNGQVYREFVLSQRDTLVGVSGYSVELRARIIDRWQELEARADQFQIPATYAEALQAVADQAKENQSLRLVILDQAPKVAAIKRLAAAEGAIYAIYNPTTLTSALLAVNATAARQPEVYAGANMPAGYTASALVSVWPTNASGQLIVGGQVGRWVSRNSVAVVNTALATGTPTLINLSAAVPRNAVRCGGTGGIAGPSGSNNAMTIQQDAAGTGLQYISAGPTSGISGNWLLTLLTDQVLYATYTVSLAPGGFTIGVSSYEF